MKLNKISEMMPRSCQKTSLDIQDEMWLVYKSWWHRNHSCGSSLQMFFFDRDKHDKVHMGAHGWLPGLASHRNALHVGNSSGSSWMSQAPKLHFNKVFVNLLVLLSGLSSVLMVVWLIGVLFYVPFLWDVSSVTPILPWINVVHNSKDTI